MTRFFAPALFGIALTAGAAHSVTISPTDYNAVLTEDGREFTVDGADISGNGAEIGNNDIDRFRVSGLDAGENVLLSGRALENDRDRWVFRNVTGLFTVDLLNIAGSTAVERGPFSSRFVIRVDGVNQGSFNFDSATLGALPATLFSQTLNDSRVVIVARDRNNAGGASDYDLGVSLAAVPLPASSLLLLGGLAGLGAMSRRKRRS